MSESKRELEPPRESASSTFEEFAHEILRRSPKYRQRIVAIDGGGGAGKTTFASRLSQAIPESRIVKIDDFYRPPKLRVPLESTKIINPNFDWDRLRTLVLEAIKEGREVRYQLYDFDKETLSGNTISIPRDATIIVEGVWSLQEAFTDCYDYRIWLDAPADIRMERGVARDGEEFREVWEQEWIPIDEYYQKTSHPERQANCVVDSFHSDFSKNKIFLTYGNKGIHKPS